MLRNPSAAVRGWTRNSLGQRSACFRVHPRTAFPGVAALSAADSSSRLLMPIGRRYVAGPRNSPPCPDRVDGRPRRRRDGTRRPCPPSRGPRRLPRRARRRPPRLHRRDEPRAADAAQRDPRLCAAARDVGAHRRAAAVAAARPQGRTPSAAAGQHTEIGALLLSGSRFPLLRLAQEIARTHHEWWNGHGYQGLVGEAIPLASRWSRSPTPSTRSPMIGPIARRDGAPARSRDGARTGRQPHVAARLTAERASASRSPLIRTG